MVHDVSVRVLVVEDHVELARDIAEGLRDRGIATDLAYDGAAALQKGVVYRYDVIVLDRDLPGVHGDAVCVALRDGGSDARILMLTAAAAIGDRVEGLNLGADDYLPKPFAFEELVARVHALARRAPAGPPLLVRGDLVLDRARRRATRAGRELSLTRKELGVLEVLLAADGAVVSAEELLERVWDENADPFTRTVAVTLGRLRRKLGEPEVIETVRRRRLPHAMTPASLSVAVRRLWPRRMRTRLAVFYAVLFLLAGVVLLALTLHAGGQRAAARPRRHRRSCSRRRNRRCWACASHCPRLRVAAREMQPPDRHRRSRPQGARRRAGRPAGRVGDRPRRSWRSPRPASAGSSPGER